MTKFTHLHVHTHYSLLDGLPKIDELLNYTKKLGMDSIALTDHGVLYGAVEFYKKAKEIGIKPIIGCELYQSYEGMTQKRPNIDSKRYHLILLVKNEEGYKNLVKLVTKAQLEGFYYKPRIDEDLLAQHSKGLICLSACLQGKIPQLILANRLEDAKKQALKYQEIFSKDNFYLEIQHHQNIPEQEKINKNLIIFSKELNIPLVATNDSHYLKPEDTEVQDVLMLINTGADSNDPERLTMKDNNFSLRKPEEMAELFKETPEAIENTQKIAESCNFQFELGKTKLPTFQVPDGKTAEQYLEELCYKGIPARYGENLPINSENLSRTHDSSTIGADPKVIERLNYELSVIKKTGFAGYFLIVQDFVNWAKSNRIVVGPGRGSAGGSLVAYLTNITNVDPLKHNLLFERFLNPERISMPDIDLDFTDRRRNEVINYIGQKYGKDHVAQIITFGTMAARAVIRDVGRALAIPYSYCDRIAKMIPFGMSLKEALDGVSEFKELYESDAEAKRLIDLAKNLEGVARHASTHACGVVISEKPLTDYVPLQHPTQDDETIVTQYEMHAIEDLGLLKMDLLGLKNLTIIEDCLARIYQIYGKSIQVDNIPADDEKTYKLFQEANTIGIFQLESSGMQNYLKQLKPTSFDDIVAMVALYRPGPMQFIPDFIKGKHKKKKIEYLHPKLQPILESTYGICVYQEQLMQIAQHLAGFSLSEADVLRKAIGKKINDLLQAQEQKFISGCIKNEVPKKTAQELWQWILPFASYGFNKSHSVGYATIACQTAYLKAHYPVEFMAALLTSEKSDIERIAVLIKECQKMGIPVLPPDVNESFRNFSVIPNENKIRFGLLAIKNVGENIVEAILAERKAKGNFKSMYDFISRIQSKTLNKKSFESLIKTGVFDKLEDRSKLLYNMEDILEANREIKQNMNNNQTSLFANSSSYNPSVLRLKEAQNISLNDQLNWEKELLGLYISAHPLDSFKSVLEKNSYPLSRLDNDVVGKLVKIGGVISTIKRIITRNGKPMLFMSLEDLTNKVEVVVFPTVIDRNPTVLQENKIVFVKGKVDNRDGEIKVIADEIEEIINTD
ncbi:DNA polymerase III subunit alpha [Patescibacteria group bacterium]|nr:DNA polymerase III subunit alpha [Patescibacteria group bacterium]